MADDSDKNDNYEWWAWFFGGIIVLGLLNNFANRAINFVSGDLKVVSSDNSIDETASNFSVIGEIVDNIGAWFLTFSISESFPTFTTILYILTGLALLVFFYSKIQANWILNEWNKEIGYNRSSKETEDNPKAVVSTSDLAGIKDGIDIDEDSGLPKNERWLHIESLIKSEHENDWRSAIIEADIMLDELLSNLNYEGKTVAEKLQQVSPNDFKYLQDAWEAHKVRNRIAHEGNIFNLDRELFLQTIRKFERVFEDQHII